MLNKDSNRGLFAQTLTSYPQVWLSSISVCCSGKRGTSHLSLAPSARIHGDLSRNTRIILTTSAQPVFLLFVEEQVSQQRAPRNTQSVPLFEQASFSHHLVKVKCIYLPSLLIDCIY